MDPLTILKVLLERPPTYRPDEVTCICVHCQRDLIGWHYTDLWVHDPNCPYARAKEMMEGQDG